MEIVPLCCLGPETIKQGPAIIYSAPLTTVVKLDQAHDDHPLSLLASLNTTHDFDPEALLGTEFFGTMFYVLLLLIS